MHPNPAFRAFEADPLDWADGIGFATIALAADSQPMVVHAPVSRVGDRLRFHVARGNRVTPHLDGAAVVVSVAGAEGYISPNWYERPGDQVPTWNYVAAEFDGVARQLTEEALVEQLDALATTHEPRVNPAAPWHRDKMDNAIFRRMLRAIVGFEVTVGAMRTTAKLSQNKSPADRAGVVAGLLAHGNIALAGAMQA